MPFYMLVFVALIQGLTEFLPVSSSGHLALIPAITDQPYQGRTIDVAAHVGTLVAVLWFMRAELIAMAKSLLSGGKEDPASFRMVWLLALATIPALFVGYWVNKWNPAWLLDIRTLATANLVFAGFLWAADRAGDLRYSLADMRLGGAILIGLAQIFAFIPGASRSGVTMTAARWLGFGRISAARFSLLLSIPTIAGAGLLKTVDMIKAGDSALGYDAAVVAIISCGIALLAIHAMMRWLARANFTLFVRYRIALGLFLFAAIYSGMIT